MYMVKENMKPSEHDAGAVSAFKLLTRAFRHRNYCLFFAGQSVSLIGTWIQNIAMSWLVYRLTGSAFLLGLIGFTSQIPLFLLSPFTGVLADRCNRQHVLIWTQTLSLIQATLLAVLVLTDTVRVAQLIILSVFIGVVNAVDVPARQAFVLEMVESREDLGNAIALNSAMFNGARLIGPSIAGIMIATIGEGTCFLINAISYVGVIAALAAMKVKRKEPAAKGTRILQGLREGFAYAYGFLPIRAILLLLVLISLVGMPYIVLLPILAKDILLGGAHTFGFLMSASGVGALTSTLYLAARRNVLGLGRVIYLSCGLFAIALMGLSFSRTMWMAIPFCLLAGLGMIAQLASSNTIIQTIVDEDKRGRIMSIHAMSFLGMSPFGSLMCGSLASRIGVPYTMLMGGAICLAGSFLFRRSLPAIRKAARPVYMQMGILPQTPPEAKSGDGT